MYSRKLIVVLSLLLCFLTGAAQDIIVKRNGSRIQGKVTEITETVVKYKKAENPNGPTYSINSDDVDRINYENGEADVFVDEEPNVPATVLAGKTGTVNDRDLYKIYNLNRDYYNTPKKLKLWGFIGGGCLIAAGVSLMASVSFMPDYGPGLFYSGTALAGIGVVAMPTCCIIAQYKKKQREEELYLYSMPVYRQNVLEMDGKSLSVGVDFMADMKQVRTLGLGMTFKF